MTKHTRFFSRSLMNAVLFFLCMVGSAAAECGQFKPLGDLTKQMRLVAIGQTPSGDAAARQVARQMQKVELGQVRRRLQELNMSAQFRHVEQLVAIATEYSRTTRTTDQVALARNVYNLEMLFEVICRPELEDGATNNDLRIAKTGYLALLAESGESNLKIFLLLLFFGATIGLMQLLRNVVGYAVGFVHQKKICRVPAQIHGNGLVFPGIVTRAGLNGVRFEFESDDIAKRLTDLMASAGFVCFDLWIDDDKWPVFVDGFHKFFSPLYFFKRLKRSELDAILVRSTRAVKNAPAIGHKSNRRKWRAQIRQRKADIRVAAQERAGVR